MGGERIGKTLVGDRQGRRWFTVLDSDVGSGIKKQMVLYAIQYYNTNQLPLINAVNAFCLVL